MKKSYFLLFLLSSLLLHSCVTYYQKSAKFNKLFESGKLEAADKLLAKDKKAERRKTRLLYYLNRGTLAHLMGKYEESNYFFEQAYITHEDFLAKPINEALAFVTNPTVTDYRGEDHEVLLIHYYKTLNFLQLGKNNEALVECRRLNIKLNQLSDKYQSDNKYRRDAFIHTLMGLVYQANHDYNNAFIAYRNAVEIYQEDYKRLFGVDTPEQLKQDLLYTAYKTGFYDQVHKYEQLFNLKYNPSEESTTGDLVFLWNNGLGPIKSEWDISFVIVRGTGGMVTFVNEERGLFFPFPLESNNSAIGTLSDLEFIQVAFPQYVERPTLYDNAVISTNGCTYPFEIAEDINAISFKVLNQRMLLEFGKSLLRVALKKAAEYQLRSKDDKLGAVLGVVNLATEKADTRNWQTMPHSIYYTRVTLPAGKQQVSFQAFSKKSLQDNQREDFYSDVKQGQTQFYTFSSLR
ncbi:MAG: hypothetical protein MI674_03300 [Cytophagales bacterium]|nr:hypothetical protein [Cytophagales bacterium]